MTTPEPLVEVLVAPERVLPGDLLADDGDARVETVNADLPLPYVYAFTPEQRPLPRGLLVRVRRARNAEGTPTVGALDDLHTAIADVRDLALALADQAGKATPATTKRVADAADKIKGKANP